MATSEGIPSSIDIEFLELNDNPYLITTQTIPFYSIMLKNIRFLNRIYVINESFIYRAEGRYL